MAALPRLQASQFVAGALAVSLLALGLPQTMASAWKLWTDEWTTLTDAAPVSQPEQVLANAAALESLDRWLDDPAARIRAGLLRLGTAYGHVGMPAFAQDIAIVTADLTEGLERAPGNPMAWVALAHARFAAGDFDRAQQALRASLLLGPQEKELAFWRTQIGLQLWPKLDADNRELIANEIQTAWQMSPDLVVGLAASRPDLRGRITELLAQNPTAAAALAKALKAPR